MRLPRYGQYKATEFPWVGEIPAHWDVVPLKRVVARVESGVSVNAVDTPAQGDSAGVLKTSCVYGGRFDPTENKAVLREELHRVACPVVEGALIVSRMNTPALVGAAGLVTEEVKNMYLPDRLWQVHFDDADPRFVHYWASSPTYRAQVRSACAGTSASMQNLSQEDFLGFALALPHRAEQVAIARFLHRETGKIDALILEQEKLIALLAEKRQATICHAVTRGLDPDAPMKDSGVPWLGGVPAHWDVRTISSLSTKITNGFVGPTRDVLVETGVRYLQSLHIKDNAIRFDEPYYVREDWSNAHAKSILCVDDVLIVQTGDIGQVAVVTNEFAGCNCHALIIVAPVRDVISGKWLSWVLNSDYGFHSLLSIQTGALHPHLNCGNVKSLFVPLPPIREQTEIVAQLEISLSAFAELSVQAERAVILLKERRSALIAAAVTGQIDVRGAVVARDPHRTPDPETCAIA